MITYKELVGQRIAKRREAAGYPSQSALARAMDISPSRVNDWENGRREPKGDLKKTLLRLLGASEKEIFAIDIQPVANEPQPVDPAALEAIKAAAREGAASTQDKIKELEAEIERLKSIAELSDMEHELLTSFRDADSVLKLETMAWATQKREWKEAANAERRRIADLQFQIDEERQSKADEKTVNARERGRKGPPDSK